MQLSNARELINRAIEEQAFPGAVLAVGNSEKVSIESFGVTTSLDDGSKVSPTTIYDLASVSKIFTTMAALMLLERGQFRLDDPVGRFLPSFAQGDKEGIRLRHLLTHTSGMAAHAPHYQTVQGKEEMLSIIAAQPLEYSTGSQVVYSCLGYITLANVIEKVAGQGLDQFLQENLFAPLNMTNTSYGAQHLPRQLVAPTELCPWRQRLAWGDVHDENANAQGGVSGNAGVFSNASDLARFCQMLLRQGQWELRHILSPVTIDVSRQNYTSGLQQNRGLGWHLPSAEYSWSGDLAPASSFGHTGFTGTSLWISPEMDLFVVLLTNRVHPSRDNVKHIRYRPLIHNAVLAQMSHQSH